MPTSPRRKAGAKRENLRRIRNFPRADRVVRPYRGVAISKRADVLNRPLRRCASHLKLPLYTPRGGACRAKHSSRRTAPKVCCSAVGSSQLFQTGKIPNKERECSRDRKHSRSLPHKLSGPPGSLRGRAPLFFENVQRKPFQKVFFGVFFLLPSVFFLVRTRKKMRDGPAGVHRQQ